MCWIDDLLDFWFPSPQRDKVADIPDEPVDTYDWDAPFPFKIPGFFRRHIPCEPCPSAVEEAERVLRR